MVSISKIESLFRPVLVEFNTRKLEHSTFDILFQQKCRFACDL